MSEEKFELVRRLIDAFNARDGEAACAVLSNDAEWRPAYTGGGELEGAVYRGHEGFRRYLDDLAETWREMEGYIDDLIHKLKNMGGRQEVEEALRRARRLLVRGQQ